MLQRLTTASIFFMLLLAVILFASGVAMAQQNNPGDDPGDDPGDQAPANQAPDAIGTIPDLNLTVGGTSGTINLGTYFSDPEDETLTYGGGSSDTSIASVSISNNSLTIPFNPETWIPYQLSKATDVAVTIYASDGNVVRTLVLGHQAAGMYHNRTQAAYWDGRNALGESVASGVYFYTLTAGDFVATRKMLILK